MGIEKRARIHAIMDGRVVNIVDESANDYGGHRSMRWGDQLGFCDEADPGDFICVPPYVPHQEINARADMPCEAVVVRSGQDAVVIRSISIAGWSVNPCRSLHNPSVAFQHSNKEPFIVEELFDLQASMPTRVNRTCSRLIIRYHLVEGFNGC